MPIGHPDFNRLVGSTIQKYLPTMHDNVFTSKPWLFALETFGNVETLDGGTQIVQGLMYAETENKGSYAGSDTFSTDEDEGTTSAAYDWKGYYGTIRLSGMEVAKNSGASAVFRIVETEVNRLQLSIAEDLDRIFLADGSGNAGKDFNGVANLVSDTAPVGGINPTEAGREWWASHVTGTVGNLTAFAPLRKMYLTVSEGNDFPTNIFTTQDLYERLDSLFEQRQRFMDPTMADQGFETIMFHGAPISFDRNIPAEQILVLNLKYFHLWKLGSRWFEASDWVEPYNQDVMIKKVILNGQLGVSNRKRQGLLTGVLLA